MNLIFMKTYPIKAGERYPAFCSRTSLYNLFDGKVACRQRRYDFSCRNANDPFFGIEPDRFHMARYRDANLTEMYLTRDFTTSIQQEHGRSINLANR